MKNPHLERWMGGAMFALTLGLLSCAGVKTVAPPRPTAANAPYLIGPGDQLSIVVWKEDQLSTKVQVRPDGKITVPLLGDVEAAGRPPADLASGIQKGLRSYVDDPRVSVSVEASARRFFVIGNVKAPGMYGLRSDETVLQGLAVAGGLTEFANRGGVRIIRGGVDAAIAVDYDAIAGGREPDIPLKPNDTIVVP